MNRAEISLNYRWRFAPGWKDRWAAAAFDAAEGAEPVCLPHTVKDLPLNYFDEASWQGDYAYQRVLELSEEDCAGRLFLRFEGAAVRARVYINGALVADHAGPYTEFRPELSAAVRPGENLVSVRLDTREDPQVPPFGGVVDYLVYGGLYREVYLEKRPRSYIADLFARPVFEAGRPAALEADLVLDGPASGTLELELLERPAGAVIARASAPAAGTSSDEASAGAAAPVTVRLECPSVRPWDLDDPVLYTLRARFIPEGPDAAVDRDELCMAVGFREARFTPEGFFLNGRPVKLRGLNRHQSWPHAGYAMPASAQREDAELLKFRLGLNIVRTSHYPQSPHFLDRCDEIGLLVFTETPGWQHVGEGIWRERVLQDVRDMVLRDRSRPSVVLWGVRINESPDCRELYEKTNELARRLDPTRQTGGVRNFRGSEFLEDVYTYNDFVHSGGRTALEGRRPIARASVPYLVTEHNGHMYPTKSWDDEEQRLEHALRHARVLNAAYGDGSTCGAIGWCMADYNTHRDFGSGDRICHHGVLDLFRLPKLAAAVYASQAEQEDVLEVSSTMDIGEHPAGRLGEVWAFTNADCVRVYKNGRLLGDFYPDRAAFPHLPHPPVRIDDFIGKALEEEEGLPPRKARAAKAVLLAVARYGTALPWAWKLRAAWAMLRLGIGFSTAARWYGAYVQNWGSAQVSYRFEALRAGEVRATAERSAVVERRLVLRADRTELDVSRSWDALRLEILAVDQHGNRLPYCFAGLSLSVDGGAEILGGGLASLVAGGRAVYVRSAAVPPPPGARLTFRAEAEGIGSAELELTIAGA